MYLASLVKGLKVKTFFISLGFFSFQSAFAISWWDLTEDKAHAFVKNGSLVEAEQQYQKELKERPLVLDLYYNLGWVQYKLTKYKEAIASFEQGIDLAKQGKYFWLEKTKNKFLIQSYFAIGNSEYNLGNLEASINAYTEAFLYDPHSNFSELLTPLVKNLEFLNQERDKKRLLLDQAAKPLKKPLVKVEISKANPSDLSVESELESTPLDMEDIHFPESFDDKGLMDFEKSSKASTLENLKKLTPQELESKKSLLADQWNKAVESQELKKKEKEEILAQQRSSPEAQQLQKQSQEWTAPEQKPSVASSIKYEMSDESGMQATSDEKLYFTVIPYEGVEYATQIFNRFDPVKNVWTYDLSKSFDYLLDDHSWDLESKDSVIRSEGVFYSADDQFAISLLPVREGYAVDSKSIRFESAHISSYHLKRKALGAYTLTAQGSSLQNSRFVFDLKKLRRPHEAEAKVEAHDTLPLIQSVPDFIKRDLDSKLSVITSTEDRAKSIEAFILRRGIYTDNNDEAARLMENFIAQGKDFQGRFNQMARVLNQKNDLSYPEALRDVGLNCSWWSDFFLALARYYKIPARKVTGFYNRFPLDKELRGTERHAWVSIWSDKQNKWIWLEPTPRGGLSEAQQDRLNEEELNSERAMLEWISAQKERPQSPEAPKENDSIESTDLQKNSNDKDDFDWIQYSDPSSRGEMSQEQREKLRKAIEAYAAKENEYRLQRKSKRNTVEERLFEAKKYREGLIEEEVRVNSSFIAAAKVFNIISVKKELSPKDEAFKVAYKKSRDLLLARAFKLLTLPKHEAEVDPEMLTAEILHALALVEPIVKMDPENPKKYKEILSLARNYFSKIKPGFFYEIIASNETYLFINAKGKLYKGFLDGFSFEDMNFDLSPFSEIHSSALTPDAKHWAMVAKSGDVLHLVRDGKSRLLPFAEILQLGFADEKGEILIASGRKRIEGYYNPHVTLLNDELKENVRFDFLNSPKKGIPRLGTWIEERFDAQGLTDEVISYLYVNGKRVFDPQSKSPFVIGYADDYTGSQRAFADGKNVLVIVRDRDKKFKLLENYTKVLLTSENNSIYVNSYPSKSGDILFAKVSLGEVNYFYENGSLRKAEPGELAPNDEIKKLDVKEVKIPGSKLLRYELNGKPLRLENGKIVTNQEYCDAYVRRFNYLTFFNFSVDPLTKDQKYLYSNIFKIDPDRNFIIPIPVYDSSGNKVIFEEVSDFQVNSKGDYAYLGLKNNRIYLVRNGKIDPNIIPQRSNVGSSSSIRGDVSISSHHDFVLWQTGGDYFPYTTWLGNVPLYTTSTSRWLSSSESSNKDVLLSISKVKSFLYLNEESMEFRLRSLEKYLVEESFDDFYKSFEGIKSNPSLSQADLVYLLRNLAFFAHRDEPKSDKDLETLKSVFVSNILRIPSLPLSRLERVSAVLDFLEWRSQYENSGGIDELQSLVDTCFENKILTYLSLDIERQMNDSSWSLLDPSVRRVKVDFLKKAKRALGAPFENNW